MLRTEYRLVIFNAPLAAGRPPFESYSYWDTFDAASAAADRAKLVEGYAGHQITKITTEVVEAKGFTNLYDLRRFILNGGTL